MKATFVAASCLMSTLASAQQADCVKFDGSWRLAAGEKPSAGNLRDSFTVAENHMRFANGTDYAIAECQTAGSMTLGVFGDARLLGLDEKGGERLTFTDEDGFEGRFERVGRLTK